jgi:hypothetical protein
MRPDRTKELPSTRKSVWYYPEVDGVESPQLEQRNVYFESSQSHMLIEDVRVQVIPYVRLSEEELFGVDLAPPSEEVESLVAAALKSRDRGWRDELSSSLADFVRECTQSVIAVGEAIYEIVYFSNPVDQKLVAFEFEPIRPFTVKSRRGQFIQQIPQKTAERLGISNSINLPSDSILVFQLSPALRKGLEETLQGLVVLSKKLMPEFALNNLGEAASRFNYDSANQIYARKLALAEAGKAIGWNARGLFTDDMLEYYSLKRHLSFEKFKIELRNSIVQALNEGLKRVGQHMGFEAQIRLHGLPTLSDVERAESELAAGGKAFGEILKPFLSK